MTHPTCPSCDCVAGCQSRARLCPNLAEKADGTFIDEGTKAVMQQALDALEGVLDDDKDLMKASISGGLYEVFDCQRSIASLRAAIAQPEQTNISEFTIADLAIKHLGSYADKDYDFAVAVIGAFKVAQPEQQTPVRQPLTDDDIDELFTSIRAELCAIGGGDKQISQVRRCIARAVEAAHGIAQPKDKP